MTKNTLIIHIMQSFGGVASVVKNLINFQLEKGFRVGIMYPKNIESKIENYFSELVERYPIKFLSIKGLSQLQGFPIKKMYKTICKNNRDTKITLHAHGPAPVGLLRNIDGLPLVCTIHGVNAANKRISNIISNAVIKRMNKHNIIIVGVSQHTSDYYNKILRKNCIHTILNGANIQIGEPVIKNKNFTLGFVAYINDFKGWEIVLKAYCLLDDTYKKNIDLVFAGSGNQKTIDKLKTSITTQNLKNVYYLGNVKSASNTLIPYLNLVILPSISEGLSMTLVESIGNGVPILATEVGGNPEILYEGINGFFVKRNPIIIADYIKKIYDDESLYNQLSKNSKDIFNYKFSGDDMNENYINLYKTIYKL